MELWNNMKLTIEVAKAVKCVAKATLISHLCKWTWCTHTHTTIWGKKKHVMMTTMQLVTIVVSYLALWFFMKFGPCLRNSVVSPKTGQPIVPGGKPFFLYLTSFHLKSAEQKQSTTTTPTIAIKTPITAPTLNPKETSKRRYNLFSWRHHKTAHKHTYLLALHLVLPFHIRIRINHKDKKKKNSNSKCL